MKRINRPEFRFGALLLLQLGILISAALLRSTKLLFHSTEVFFWKVVFQRGLPLVFAFDIFAFIGAFFLLKRSGKFVFRRHLKDFIWIAVVFLCLTVIALWIGFSRIGLEKENAFYGKPTVPLLEWHLFAAFLLCLAVLLTENRFSVLQKFEGAIPVFLWFVTFAVWIGIPNQNGFFAPAGRAPNFETYPFSDGSFYGHFARSAAAGMGFKGNDIPPRPLYIAVLSLLHLLGNNDYDRIIILQTFLLAWLPPVIYLIGKELNHRPAGLAAALLVLLRETHAIFVAPFGHNVSTTKYFFSDLPTALCGALLVLSVLRLLKALDSDEKSVPVHALFTGCLLGAMTLIRTQSLCLIIPIATALLSHRKSLGKACLCIAASLIICLAPWLIRNKGITGSFVFDHPMTQTAEMARSYNFDGLDLDRLPEENDGAYTERLSLTIADSLKKHKAEIGRFILVHFINSEADNLRLLPLRDRLTDPKELFRSRVPFWEELDTGSLDTYNLIFLGLGTLLLLSGIAFVRHETGGFLPIACNMLFNLSTAVGRYSGGRYLIPLDWVIMLYIGLGFEAFLRFDIECCGMRLPSQAERTHRPTLGIWLPCACILLTAGLIPAVEHFIPQRFIPEPPEFVREVLGNPALPCEPSEQIFLNAIAIYPRFYAAGEGEPESAKQGYAATDHSRLIFLTLSPGAFGTFEMETETPPESFPDGAEVRIAACQAGATSHIKVLEILPDEAQ